MELLSLKQRFGLIGNSPELNYALDVATRVAPTNLTVLITGESGVGKEIFSHIIHQLSPRKHNKFIAVNCGAIPEGTIDSELFGHEKGSFTGASESRKGYFEVVDNGSIFLDEIGEMPLGTQSRLLRVLESGEYIKVGSSKVQKTDVRIIAASNIDLYDAVRKGKFREDLYYRLSTVPIKVPPLRDRKDDIYLLFRKFVVDFAEKHRRTPIKLTDEARELLLKYRWPGNIRELKNTSEQLSVLSKEKIVNVDNLKQCLPNIQRNNLPALMGDNAEGKIGDGTTEREILFKLFFDMKRDLNELKKFILDMAQKQQTDLSKFPDLRTTDDTKQLIKSEVVTSSDYEGEIQEEVGQAPIIISSPEKYKEVEIVDSLSLADMEREMIEKALLKHKNRRKDAALDLGISERTLYRKIKEYKINA